MTLSARDRAGPAADVPPPLSEDDVTPPASVSGATTPSSVPGAAAAALVAEFDVLIENQAPVDVVLRRAAELAECPAGLDHDGLGPLVAGGPAGAGHGGVPPVAAVRPLRSGGVVWLDRPGGARPLDAVLLERLAIACTVAIATRAGHPRLGDPGLLQLCVDDTVGDLERSRALDALGLAHSTPVTIMAVHGPPRSTAGIVAVLGGPARGVRATALGPVDLLLCPRPVPDQFPVPVGARVGVGPPGTAAELPRAWREARAALRFALPCRHPLPPYPEDEGVIVRAELLGGYALLPRLVTGADIADVDDVRRLDELAAEPGGADMIRTLVAVAANESLRKAAAVVHLHHTSVAQKVARAEQVLGFDLTEGYGRSRLMVGLMLQRIRGSAPLG
ncbi:helix-turn-helix domain-containing protein [Pseudonocardia nematodicida]|uniref:Helix-turn-helix domain-containing protein n=1 Tax=Pseudonocardia nematodicida TaxID=1206997 RepID=A0ABV1K5A2_9PSEU